MGRNGVLGVVVPIYSDGVMHDIFHGKSVHASLAQGEGTDLEDGSSRRSQSATSEVQD